MRTRQIRTLVASFILAFLVSSFPVMAAPRERHGWLQRELPFVGKFIKHLRKTFGIGTNSDGLTLPTPKP
jgi:hypothetical protein